MAHTTSALATKMSTEAQNNEGIPWTTVEAAVEVLKTAISGVTLGASDAAADPGSDALKAISVQGVTGGKAVPISVATIPSHAVTNAGTFAVQAADRQYAGVPSSFSIQTADATVFTLAAGEIGFIQNLSADAPLAVKKGASCSTTSLNFILKASTAASDGTGGAVEIKDWIGAVSVAKMTGTASYLAYKQAVA